MRTARGGTRLLPVRRAAGRLRRAADAAVLPRLPLLPELRDRVLAVDPLRLRADDEDVRELRDPGGEDVRLAMRPG